MEGFENRFEHDFRTAGAFEIGHFRYRDADMDGDTFFNSSVLVEDPVLMKKVVGALVAELVRKHHPRTIVATPHARELAQAMAWRYHEFGVHPRVVYAVGSPEEGYRFPFRFGNHVERSRVIVADAVVNSGKRARGVIKACRELGAEVLALASVANRGACSAATFETAYAMAHVISEPQYERAACPQCAACVPLDDAYSRMVA